MKTLWKLLGHTLEWVAIIIFCIVVAPLFIFLIINYVGLVGVLAIIVLGIMSLLYGVQVLLQWIFGHNEPEEENPDDWFI